jgi:hypothetical protein
MSRISQRIMLVVSLVSAVLIGFAAASGAALAGRNWG